MSLAGVQNKLGVAVDDARSNLRPHEAPVDAQPIPADSLFGGVQNEALCLTLASALRPQRAEGITGKAGKRTYLPSPQPRMAASAMAAVDRTSQALACRRAEYEANQNGIKGPTLADMFALTRNAMRAPDVLNLLDYVIFNILVCNTDAHAKNYSLMISGKGFSLAPHLRRHVRGSLGWHHTQSGAEDRRQEPRRAPEATALADSSPQTAGSMRHETRSSASTNWRNRRCGKSSAAAAEVNAMPAGTHVLMPKFVEAIELRARAIIRGLVDESSRCDRSQLPLEPRAVAKRRSGPAA